MTADGARRSAWSETAHELILSDFDAPLRGPSRCFWPQSQFKKLLLYRLGRRSLIYRLSKPDFEAGPNGDYIRRRGIPVNHPSASTYNCRKSTSTMKCLVGGQEAPI